MTRRTVVPLLLLALGCKAEHPSTTPGIPVASADSAIRTAMRAGTAWPSYGRDYSNQRYSPVAQIDTTNIGRLGLAWHYRNGIISAYETSPVVVDGVMYISTPLNHVVALDAVTGAKKWEYVHHYRTTVDCCGPINRGVAVYGGRVFMGTVDARLVALDARTGEKLWDATVGNNELGYHITSAPVAVAGKVITGISCGEQGGRCYVSAYDAADGHLVWRFYTIPSPAEGGWWGKWKTTDPFGTPLPRDIAREKADSAQYADTWQHGGGPAWHHPAYDASSGLLFVNTGNPAPDLDGSGRPGDNLYTDCVVALDVKTGKVRWYYQIVPHDLWDYDTSPPAVLVDVRDSTGHVVPAVAQASKVPWVFVLDRRTGKPIRRSDAYIPTEHFLEPPNAQGVLIAPGTLGGTDWSPPAYDPRTSRLYLASNYIPTLYRVKPEALRPPAQWWGGTAVGKSTGTYGLLTAIDLNTGKVVWQTRTAKPLLGGVTVTAGGLLFAGLSDEKLVALDAATGTQLWSADAPAGVNAPPITYMANGVQYVAVAATGAMNVGSKRGDALLAFALPSTAGTR